jgi:hypothetical protein
VLAASTTSAGQERSSRRRMPASLRAAACSFASYRAK